ncbi:hypothetical protein A4H97_22020 [Niastella yeongjuensis]|uniref:Uncharacterized protein n=1 Tax=Niastella yeongjuensis TaxID=354355 RepID=A0A1V9F8A2_9BACT|nr:hypothetical protein A4H97_22020 [Niastella yeongjuensis]SEO02025.1 hypothetical protein SAMN05660816_01919 [Niastella yeongjuensis]
MAFFFVAGCRFPGPGPRALNAGIITNSQPAINLSPVPGTYSLQVLHGLAGKGSITNSFNFKPAQTCNNVLFVLVICVLMLNLVLANCCAMLYTYRKATQLQGIDRWNGIYSHPNISTGNTHIIPVNPTHLFLSSLPPGC